MSNNQERDLKFVQENFVLTNVNWDRLVENSIAEKSLTEEKSLPKTDFNIPLLQVCIDNEEV